MVARRPTMGEGIRALHGQGWASAHWLAGTEACIAASTPLQCTADTCASSLVPSAHAEVVEPPNQLLC